MTDTLTPSSTAAPAKRPAGWLAAILSSAVVLAVIAAGIWIIAFGLPSGEVANWWLLVGTLLILLLAVVGLRYVDARRMSLLKKCLIISVLIHILIALAFSAVGVTRQVVRWVKHEPMTPAVNVQLAREFEVREHIRQQVQDAPRPEQTAPLAQTPVNSPLPPVTPQLAPAEAPADQPRQLALNQNPIAPTLPQAPVAPDLTTPLLPVRPQLTPMRESTPLPASAADAASTLTRMPGPVDQQLGHATSPIPGVGAGSLGAPPASLAQGIGGGQTSAGSGTGKPFSLLTQANLPNAGAALVPAPPPIIAPIPVAPRPADQLSQRTFDERQKALEKYGGTSKTEAAVARALAYLSRMQQSDGHWTKLMDELPAGRATDAHDTALTGLATLCFLAADHTPDKPGPYQDNVKRALNYLLRREGSDGDLRGDGNMYDQGMASLALGEAAAMTRDPRITEAAHRAAQFIVAAQNRAGGWRYTPRDLFSDTSVMGWQVLAMHSAEQSGFQIPDEVKRKTLAYLASVSAGDEGMLAGYLTAIPTSTMTAEATFSRILLGVALTPAQLQEAANYLLRKPPSSDAVNYYYIYYGSLAFMQMQGEGWKQWNAATSQLLLSLQQTTGTMAGSWPTNSEWGSRGGRVYTTSMATLSLEVYYRYAPRQK